MSHRINQPGMFPMPERFKMDPSKPIKSSRLQIPGFSQQLGLIVGRENKIAFFRKHLVQVDKKTPDECRRILKELDVRCRLSFSETDDGIDVKVADQVSMSVREKLRITLIRAIQKLRG